MTKPEIIGSARSTYARVVRMVCEEKGIEYTLTETTLGASELRAVHPLGKMPVLRHGDAELFESKAIATYLDRSSAGPAVFPSDPYLVARVEQWVSLVNTVMERRVVHGAGLLHLVGDQLVALVEEQEAKFSLSANAMRVRQ